MRTLDCGCEVNNDASTLLSMCSMHAGHMRAREAIQALPRNAEAPKAFDRDLQRDLVKILAPVVLAKWSTVTDAGSSAEATFQHVQEIMRRLD